MIWRTFAGHMGLIKRKSTLFYSIILLFNVGCAPIIISGTSYPKEPQRHYSINIPKGHFPPPGHCRIWYPDREAGQQPPPQRCPIPVNNVPLGTYVISRIEGNENRVLVDVYHERYPGTVVSTHYLSGQ